MIQAEDAPGLVAQPAMLLIDKDAERSTPRSKFPEHWGLQRRASWRCPGTDRGRRAQDHRAPRHSALLTLTHHSLFIAAFELGTNLFLSKLLGLLGGRMVAGLGLSLIADATIANAHLGIISNHLVEFMRAATRL